MSETALQSMTGYGRAEGTLSFEDGPSLTWRWEVKSVNGRGLDIRFRFPTGYEKLEAALRQDAACLLRGSISASLNVDLSLKDGCFEVDDTALAAALSAARKVQDQLGGEGQLSVDGLLALKGVLVPVDTSLTADQQEAAEAAVVQGFQEAVAALLAGRQKEGARLYAVLNAQLEDIARYTADAKAHADEALQHHHETLKTQITDLLADASFSEERLAQEAAALAVKSDIREELDRLEGHHIAAVQTLTEGGAVGRSLDFLAQEFMREANTLTVKSPTLKTKQIGLALKGVVDQFKEQIQNIA